MKRMAFEVMKIRFDKERSNLEDMPVAVRKPLFRILNPYTEGAVIRKGYQWIPVSIDDTFLYSVNYKFDERKNKIP